VKDAKLMLVLRTFTGADWRGFADFVASPCYNKQEELVRFCAQLRELARRHFPEAAIRREKLYARLFPGRPFDEAHFRYLSSDLLKLAEAFLGLRIAEQRPAAMLARQLEAFAARDLDKSFAQTRKLAETALQTGLSDIGQLQLQHRLLSADETHFLKKNLRAHDPYLQASLDAFERYYLAQKMAYVCAMLDRMRIIRSEYHIQGLAELTAQALHLIHDPHPALRLYSLCLALLTQPNADDFYPLFCAALTQCHAGFEAAERGALFNYGANYCINKIKQGDRSFVARLVDWYKTGLDRGLLLDGEYLSPWTFKNIVRLGLGIQDYAWVSDFIQTYAPALPPEYRKDALHFNLADLAYHQRQFDEVFRHLGQVEFTDVYYSLGAKVLLLKIYFETKADEALLSLAASFRTQLSRSRALSLDARLPYLNFLKLLLRIYRATPARLPAIRQSIADTPMLNDRIWLSRQV